MNEEKEFPIQPLAQEKICEYLRKLRESKRISLEKMARDTKLNLDYLYALEQGDYQVLPAEAYVRIYLRSMAKYLQVNPSEIISRYELEKAGPQVRENAKPTRGIMALAKQQKIKPFGIALGLLAILIILSFLRTGREKSIAVTHPEIIDSIKTTQTASAQKEVAKTESTSAIPSLSPETEESKKVNPNKILLALQCVKDSSWIMVYGDSERPWRQVMQKGESHTFEATEHFYVAFGRAGVITLKLNGKDTTLPTLRKGVCRFLVDKQGIREVGYKSWIKMFPNYNPSPDSAQ